MSRLIIITTKWLSLVPKYPNYWDKSEYANSVDPDQTAPTGAVWSGSALFAIYNTLRDR